MPAPAIASVPLLRGVIPGGQQTAKALVSFPIRTGRRPFTDKTRGKRPVVMSILRGAVAATAANAATLTAVMGAELPGTDTGETLDSNGRLLPGFSPSASALGAFSQTGGYVQRIKLTTDVATATAATGVSFIRVLNGGSGYTSAPTIAFSSGAAAATAVISDDGRVVGAYVTNAGTGYTTAPTITLSGGGGTGAVLACGLGQFKDIFTKIPFAATFAPQTAGSYIWFAVWRDTLIPVTLADAGGLYALSSVLGVDPDQHTLGAGTAGTCGLTLATATHPDGTTAIGKLSVGAPATNGTNFGFPANDSVYVYALPVRAVHGSEGAVVTSKRRGGMRSLDVMWAVLTTAATADADQGSSTILVEPSTAV